jgi:putative endonuclease
MTGREGEEIAAAFLEKQGYRIVEKNFRSVSGEIDLIAWDKETVVFVEVKARSSSQFGGPVGAVNHRKQVKISLVAAGFIQRERLWSSPCRFDVVSIVRQSGKTTVDLFQNAFEPALPELMI